MIIDMNFVVERFLKKLKFCFIKKIDFKIVFGEIFYTLFFLGNLNLVLRDTNLVNIFKLVKEG